MIHVRFHTQGQATWLSTSADVSLKFAGGLLWRDGEPHRLASYRGGRWELGGESFEDIAVDERVIVFFQTAGRGQRSQEYGPFSGFETRDGAAYSGERIIARYSNDENAWVHVESNLRWEAMVVQRPAR